MSDWAKQEVEIACMKERGNKPETEWDYGCACYESALKAFNGLLEDEHSGASIVFTKNILNRLISGKPLTAIEDTPDVWSEVTYVKRGKSYQCTRMYSLFKDVYSDGRVEYRDNDRCYCVNRDDPDAPGWTNSFISKIINEKYPITMPYYPASKPFVVYCTDGLSDPKNGDYDTIGIWYVVKPDGEKETIERFFKEANGGFVEIDKKEYFERVGGTTDGNQ
jgi:hypothetical protein